MADLAASIARARKAGYSDAEIAAHIGRDPSMGPKVAAARKAGYSDEEMISHLGKVNTVKDVATALPTGMARGAGGGADMVAQAGPMGMIGSAVQTAAGVANLFQGRTERPRMPNLFSGFSDLAKRGAYKPQTRLGELADTVGSMLPNAFAPGSSSARVANVLLPAVISEGAGQAARAAGANQKTESVIRGVGAVAGGAAASLRPQNLFAQRAPPTPVNTFAARSRADVGAMRIRAREMRAAGVQPTLIDVSGERGRRLIRAVGVKNEEAGEALTENAQRLSSATKPAAMVATRRLNPDPRTATQFADDLEEIRRADANTNYGKFDAEQIEIPDAVRDMLADAPGRSIIARARADAVENQDWGRQVELDRLLEAGSNGGGLPRISAGTVDQLVIAARERGANFARRGANNRARGALTRRNQLDATLDRVEELKPARQTFRDQSRGMEIARGEGRLDPFSTDPTDYQTWLAELPQEAQQANQLAIRQDILDTLGGQKTGGSLGTLDDIATSPYARENLRATFGPNADRYIAEIAARLQQTRNATFVQPNAGSRTSVLQNDVGNQAQQALAATRSTLRGDIVSLAAQAVDAWRRRGLNPHQAEELARMAINPTQTDEAIEAIAASMAPRQRSEFLSLRKAALVGAATATTGFRERASEEP